MPMPIALTLATAGLSVWSRGDERAPHKPLLLLYALARIQRGEPRLVSFVDIERDVGPVLKQVLPQRATHVEYPFWYLQTDGVWQVEGGTDAIRRRGKRCRSGWCCGLPRVACLRNKTACGTRRLAARPSSRPCAMARHLLDAHFPETLQEDLCDRLGLSL